MQNAYGTTQNLKNRPVPAFVALLWCDGVPQIGEPLVLAGLHGSAWLLHIVFWLVATYTVAITRKL